MLLQRWHPMACWLVGALLLASCSKGPQPGAVLDEAKQAGRDGSSFKHSADDYFHDMDGAVKLDPTEVAGRNMWLVWSGGNDRFWPATYQREWAPVRAVADAVNAPYTRAAFDQESRRELEAEASRRARQTPPVAAPTETPAPRPQ